ncbi:DUF262 domain-containing protein [Helicobacter sp. 23-1048]
MSKTIEPEKQSVKVCLSRKSYYIDFYQREYVWSKETAQTLLNDIFYIFELSYNQHKDSEISKNIMEKYSWYYLNVYITNKVEGKVYIVDGQQRLSTLTLIATKLYHKLQDNDNFKSLLKDCIFSNDGFEDIFNLDNEKRHRVMDCIFDNSKDKKLPTEFKNKTEETLVERYKDISKYIDDKFKNEADSKKLRLFVLYFLERLVLVELDISQNDTPMVFEVINDRGEALKPFEILKGKLIGALPKSDVESFCAKWDNALSPLAQSESEDDFFSDLIKSKFVFKRNSAMEKSINNEYHRYIFDNNEIAQKLGFHKQNENYIKNIKNFIDKDICYYAKLYAKIIQIDNEFLEYTDINELSGQYQNILSACVINDKQEQEKIELIAKEYDRLWVLLNLNGIYDSNEFQEISYKLNELLKGVDIENYKNIFDDLIKEAIKETKGVIEVNSLLDYKSFENRNYTNLKTRSLRYLFARVEKYICDNINQTPQSSVFDIATKTGDKTGYHIEHILSRNETNRGYFESDEEFEAQRNLLGGLLLLKGKENISSGNEEYTDKLKTYSNSLVWGHSLCDDFYHSTHKGFIDFNNKVFGSKDIKFKPYQKFDKVALHERTKLLYEIVKIIWEVDR